MRDDLTDPATELLDQIARLPVRDAYEAQQRERVATLARTLLGRLELAEAEMDKGHSFADAMAECREAVGDDLFWAMPEDFKRGPPPSDGQDTPAYDPLDDDEAAAFARDLDALREAQRGRRAACVFRRYLDSDSARNRSLIPPHSGH